MSDDFEPVAQPQDSNTPPTNRRIIAIMAILGVLGTIAGFILASVAFGIGVLVGVTLAFVNYFWLQHSLKKIFAAADSGERPRMLAGRYFLRYLILGAIVAIIYASGAIPIAAVILGMAGIGFAVVVEAVIRILSIRQKPDR
jgi:ATP synthase I subunit